MTPVGHAPNNVEDAEKEPNQQDDHGLLINPEALMPAVSTLHPQKTEQCVIHSREAPE